jgi:hypothetical protein
MRTLTHLLPNLLLTTSLSLSLGCSTEDGSTGDPDQADDPASPTDIDLAAFRAHALAKLTDHFGDHDFSRTRLAFIDGAASTDLAPAFDVGRLVLIADQPALAPLPGFLPGYFLGMNGEEGQRYFDASLFYFNSFGVAVIDPQADPDDVTALIDSLVEAFPEADVALLDAIGLLTFGAPDGQDFLQIMGQVSSSDLFSSVELDPEVFRIPFEFAEPVELGTGKKKKLVELLDSTSVTANLRADGMPFVTEPSLPKPFGKGPLEASTPWIVSVVEGMDAADCAEQAGEIENVQITDTIAGAFKMKAPASVVSLVQELECVFAVDSDIDL